MTEKTMSAEELADVLGHFVNSGFGRDLDEFANALAREHPTLLGQIAKAVGLGVMRRTLGTEWKSYDPTFFGPGEANRPDFREPKYIVRGRCAGCEGVNPLTGQTITAKKADHPAHDGRLDCDTVIGAALMARQSLI